MNDAAPTRAHTARHGTDDLWRRPLAIGVLVSVAAHAALFAWITVRVPDLTEAPGTAARALDRPEPEAPAGLRVVRIQPPGVLPSGGGGATGPSAPEGSPVPAAPATPRPALAAAPSPALAPLATASEAPLAIAAALAETGATRAASRPNRGVVLREGGGSDASGRGGQVAGSGRGAGAGGGITIVGRGGDCITPGLAAPAAGPSRGGWLPNRRVGGAARIGRPGGP